MKQSDSSASPATINAHQSELACIAINQIGSRIATASEKVCFFMLSLISKAVSSDLCYSGKLISMHECIDHVYALNHRQYT